MSRDFRLWFLCALFLTIGVLSLNDAFIFSPDSARYLSWARSLAQLEGFKDATGPEPSRYVFHAPLYSVLLAPIARFSPYGIIPAKILTVGMGSLFLMLFYFWTAKKAGRSVAFWGTFFLVINPLVIIYSTQILSEIPFVACLVLFFILAEKIVASDKPSAWLVVGFLATICAGMFLRELGLAIVLSGTLFFLLRKDYQRAFLVLLVPLFFYLLWLVRNEIIVARIEVPDWRNTKLFLTHYFTGENASLLREFIVRAETNFQVYKESVGTLLFFPQFVGVKYALVLLTEPSISVVSRILKFGQYPLTIITIGFSGYGLYRVIKDSETARLLILFLLFYLIPVIFYPINDVRFLFPLIILMLYFCVMGFQDLAKRIPDTPLRTLSARVVVASLLLLLATPNLVW
ncbi:MAG: ArnT family glycosyltransferase, partial [Bacteroidota bacterium]